MLNYIIRLLFDKKSKTNKTVVCRSREIAPIQVVSVKRTALSEFFDGQSGLNVKERRYKVESSILQNRAAVSQSRDFYPQRDCPQSLRIG